MLKNFYPERNDDHHDGNNKRCFKPSWYDRDWIIMYFKQWNFILFSLFISRITQCWFVHFFLSCALLHRCVDSKVEPSYVENTKMAAGFSGVRQYVGWLISMYKVSSKLRFDVLLRGGGGFMKNVAATFSVLKSIYEWPLISHTCFFFIFHQIVGQNFKLIMFSKQLKFF